VKLYRPTGQIELELVFASGMRAWPPRLVDQPIFYPVLNRTYAREIAAKWNTKSERLVGYVTTFEVDDELVTRYERKVVGNSTHEELWVPAEDLPQLNARLQGPIEVLDAYFGDGFRGHVLEKGPFAGLSADEQLEHLRANTYLVPRIVKDHPLAVFLHYARWVESSSDSLLCGEVADAWTRFGPNYKLPGGVEAA